MLQDRAKCGEAVPVTLHCSSWIIFVGTTSDWMELCYHKLFHPEKDRRPFCMRILDEDITVDPQSLPALVSDTSCIFHCVVAKQENQICCISLLADTMTRTTSQSSAALCGEPMHFCYRASKPWQGTDNLQQFLLPPPAACKTILRRQDRAEQAPPASSPATRPQHDRHS